MASTRVLLLGDTHADGVFLEKAYNYAKEQSCDYVLQLGDFGWFPYTEWGKRFGKKARFLAQDYEIPLFFIDGNHDQHPHLWQHTKPSLDGVGIQVLGKDSHVSYISRGTVWEWDGVVFLALGGAHSVDKYRRSEGTSWWPEENIRLEDVQRAADNIEAWRVMAGGSGRVDTRIDVMVAHDAPISSRFINEACDNNMWGPQPIGEGNRKALQVVMELAQPRLYAHGHHHARYEEMTLSANAHTDLLGLGCNYDGPDAWAVLDTASFPTSKSFESRREDK